MARVFAKAELPHWDSTRDTRDRLDLVTENVPVGATLLRADRIVYHPGDSAAAHYHLGCDHVFVVLAGSGLFHAGEETHRLGAGDIATVAIEPGPSRCASSPAWKTPLPSSTTKTWSQPTW